MSAEPAYMVVEIACQKQAKGVLFEAACETTATGVKWIFTGDLAKALNIMRHAARRAATAPEEIALVGAPIDALSSQNGAA